MKRRNNAAGVTVAIDGRILGERSRAQGSAQDFKLTEGAHFSAPNFLAPKVNSLAAQLLSQWTKK